MTFVRRDTVCFAVLALAALCAVLFLQAVLASSQAVAAASPAPVATPVTSNTQDAKPQNPAETPASQSPEKAAPTAKETFESPLRDRCLHPEKYGIAISGRSKLLVELANGTIWQPRDGRIRFTVRTRDDASPSSIDKLQLRVCFGWPLKYCNGTGLCGAAAPAPGQHALTLKDRQTFHLSYDLEPIDRDATSVTFETALPAALWRNKNPPPPGFSDVLFDYFHRLVQQPSYVYDGMGLVPSVDMHIVGSSVDDLAPDADPELLDATVRVGLSFRFLAFIIAAGAIALVWRFLWICGRDRRVPGGAVLSIVANNDGYASLSQFQLVLWTFVIGGGAIYVISLSGTLISIPSQALALLGISGFSALAAALKKANDKKKSAEARALAEPTAVPPPAPAPGTPKRTPRWSDLVVWDGTGEIEITRVQMLVFTAIAAGFVAIKIIDQSAIPELPDSIVLLMGLTNGVYVGGKYTGASK